MDLNNLRSFPTQSSKPSPGMLLLSEPFLNEGYFRRAVILITENNREGSVGFILNKPSELSLNDIIENAASFDGIIQIGGPVGRDTLHFLHTAPDRILNSKSIGNGVYWGGDFEVVKDLITSGKLYPDEIKFFIGYCGWGANQLHDEIENKSWFVFKTNIDCIMNQSTNQLWTTILKEQGENYAVYANFPIDPIMN